MASGRAEHESRHRALERDHRVQGVDGAFAGRERVGRARVEREAREPVVEEDPGARHDGGRPERAEYAFDERDGVAVAVDDREIGRVGGRHERAGLAALARFRIDGAAACCDELDVEQAARIEVDARGIARVRVAIRERELLRLDHEVDELGAPPLERSDVDALDDRELLEKDVTLRDRRLAEQTETAVVD